MKEDIDLESIILGSLFITAEKIGILFETIREKWNAFSKNTPQIIEGKLIEYKKWMESVINSNSMLDVLKNFKYIFYPVLSLDCEVDHEIIYNIRKEIKHNLYYKHVPLDVLQIFIEALLEIENLINIIHKNIPTTKGEGLGSELKYNNFALPPEDRTLLTNDYLTKFIDKKKSSYKHLKDIKTDEIVKFYLTGSKYDAIRDVSRNIFTILRNKHKKIINNSISGDAIRKVVRVGL